MKFIQKNKKYLLVIIGALLAVTLTVSYSYFDSIIGDGATTNVDIVSDAPTALTFTKGDDITLNVNPVSLAEGGGNVTGSTTSTATLTVGSYETAAVTETYNVYFEITNNTFVYTSPTSEAEILLNITDPSGVTVAIPGLTEKTSGGVTGYDITTFNGLLAAKMGEEITSETFISEEWTATITFVNLSTDQSGNMSKTLESELILTKECFIVDTNTLTKCHNDTNGLFYHDASLANGANDNSYRYSGSNAVVANNYVCFGTDVSPCPADNIYRIIGYFDNGNGYEMKLIKNTSIGNMVWDDGNVNDWVNASLNTYLNNDFYNTIPASYQNMIVDTTWNLGGSSTSRITAKEFLTAEKSNTSYNNSYATTTIENIGLMYPSDYGYAAYSTAWTTDLFDYETNNIPANNWMFSGTFEWTITHHSSFSYHVWRLLNDGFVNSIDARDGYAVRPVLSLESTTKIFSGTGSSADPFTVG